MKKLTIVLVVAFFAISCNSDKETPKHDVTFELVFTFNGQEYPMAFARIGFFEDLDFNLRYSVNSFLRNQKMILNSDSIVPIHIDGRFWDISQQAIIPGIPEGSYFIAVSTGVALIGGGEQPRLGYRRIIVNRTTEVQRFVFDLSDEPNIFIEM